MKTEVRQEAKFYERYVKRVFDILFAVTALIASSPIALLCMIAIKLDDVHGKIFFRQPRNGKHGKVFTITKFRTMKRVLCGQNLEPTEDTLTRPGRIIRKLSLDEIPQFISILRGQMSLIGPRPLLLSYYEWFNKTERLRFDVRPGLTGLSQINGRAQLNWDERFALDVQYVNNLSFLTDMKIFFLTFTVIFSHKDVIPKGQDYLEDFDVYRKRQIEKAVRLATARPIKKKTLTKKMSSGT